MKGTGMKRFIIAAAVLALAMLVPNVPLSAALHGERCYERHNGGSNRTICNYVNASDAFFQEEIEGLLDYSHNPNQTDNVHIQIDYIKLWRCTGPQGATPCYLATQTFFSGWYQAPYPGNPLVPGSKSTGWYDLCANPHNGQFHTETRYRLQWMAEPGDPIGQWFVQNSLNSIETCDGN